jgi:hypothetical protein
VLAAIRELKGTALFPCRGKLCPAAKVNRRLLRIVGSPEGLTLLPLDADDFVVFQREMSVSFCGSRLQFLATFVAPVGIKEKVVRQLSKHGGST